MCVSVGTPAEVDPGSQANYKGTNTDQHVDQKRKSIVYSKQISRKGGEVVANLSVHRESSSKSIESDDSFHKTTQTVISPLNPVPVLPKDSGHPQLVNKRFSVSKAQGQQGSSIPRPSIGILRGLSRDPNNKVVFDLCPEDGEVDEEHSEFSSQNDIHAMAPLLDKDNEVYKAFRRGVCK